MSKIKEFLAPENLLATLNKAEKLYFRFPLTLLCALVVTILSIVLAEGYGNEGQLGKVLVSVALGVPLFFSIELLNERKWFSKWLPILAAIVFLIAYYFLNHLEEEFDDNKVYLFRTAVLAVVFHLFVSVFPYLKKGTDTSFWQYNKTIFLAILTSALYSATLYAGLALAILAVDKLFEFHIDGDLYLYLFFIIAFYINTNIFVGHIPELETIDKKDKYPKGLKVFTQYVLLPLVAIYLLILLSYEVKIMGQWSLPKGWVSNLVVASGIFGILAFLLLYPLKNSTSWVQKFNKAFYWVLLPLIALMFVAIFVRINQYGFTPPRYFVFVLAVWLTGISLYFIIGKKDEIKWIPITLIAVGLLSIYGPLSSFYVSKGNQESRLARVLNENNMLENGKITLNLELKLSDTNKDKLSAAIEYLGESESQVFETYLSADQYEELEGLGSYQKGKRIREWLGLQSVIVSETVEIISISRLQKGLEKNYGADYSISIQEWPEDSFRGSSKDDAITYRMERVSKTEIELKIESEQMGFDVKSVLEKDFIETNDNLTFRSESENWNGILVVNNYYQYGDSESNLDIIIYLIRK